VDITEMEILVLVPLSIAASDNMRMAILARLVSQPHIIVIIPQQDHAVGHVTQTTMLLETSVYHIPKIVVYDNISTEMFV